MIAIDTNVLVRYITNDDDEQFTKASLLLDQYAGQEKSILINNIVLCEFIWVLTQGYKYSKPQIIQTLKLLLASAEFDFEHHEIVFLACIEYENSAADFSDMLIGVINDSYNCSATYSFDKNACKTKYFQRL